MTDFKVKDLTVFINLENRFDQTNRYAPPAINSIEEVLEKLKRELYVNIRETEHELEYAQEELRYAQSITYSDAGENYGANYGEIRRLTRLISQLTSRLNSLRTASSQLDSMVIQFNQVNVNFNRMLNECIPVKEVLLSFDKLANQYIALHDISSNSGSRRYSSSKDNNQNKDDSDMHLVGDTCHFNKKGSLNQMDLDKIDSKINESSFKGNKISIDNVSQNDFSLLEKNGYTISENGPNDFSAYKEIKR